MAFQVPEQYRCKPCMYGNTAANGNNGTFMLPGIIQGRGLFIVASDWNQVAQFTDDQLQEQGLDPALRYHGWEHVSVSARWGPDFKRAALPTWGEMCYAKETFWTSPEDVAIQVHPAKSQYVNQHQFTLHLWRPIHDVLPLPPMILVGKT